MTKDEVKELISERLLIIQDSLPIEPKFYFFKNGNFYVNFKYYYQNTNCNAFGPFWISENQKKHDKFNVELLTEIADICQFLNSFFNASMTISTFHHTKNYLDIKLDFKNHGFEIK